MWSDVIYELGPLVVGAVAAALIAAYLWSRSRVASLFMVVWFGLAAEFQRALMDLYANRVYRRLRDSGTSVGR